MKRGTEIQSLRRLLVRLEKAGRKNRAPIWKRVAFLLGKPVRQRAEVNLNRISRIAAEGDTVAVPGKVLGIGEARGKIRIAALRFSKSARLKLQKAGAEMLTLDKLLESDPKGSGVKIVI